MPPRPRRSPYWHSPPGAASPATPSFSPLGSSCCPRHGGKGGISAYSLSRALLTLSIAGLDTFTYGGLQVASVAIAGATSGPILVGALAGGELLGGLLYGTWRQRAPLGRRLSRLHGCTVLLLVALATSAGGR